MSDAGAARARFPRGLVQPSGSLRFGTDALLLAAFAASYGNKTDKPFKLAELGTGCGACLLALALACPPAHGFGLERDPLLIEAAKQNSLRLGLDGQLDFFCIDIADLHLLSAYENKLDMVVANPPYSLPIDGRPSHFPIREKALRDESALLLFCKAAARLLKHHGRFCCIFKAEDLTRLCSALETANLGLRRILPVRPYAAKPSTRLLIEARKNAVARLCLDAPLTLHLPADEKGRPRWTHKALEFCPWLGT